ncbi:MAG: carbohydrate ABC transporter permease [Anaerolineae bacterium]
MSLHLAQETSMVRRQTFNLNRFLARHAVRIATYAVLVFCAFLILFPLSWAFVSSVKPNNQIFKVPLEWVPTWTAEGWSWDWQFQNFVLPFQTKPFGQFMLNSLFAAVCSVMLSLIVASLAGYSLAKYRYVGKNIAFLAILSTLMLPVQVILVPLYLVVRDLGWLDTYQGLIIPQAVNAFSIFLMRQHFLGIPDDYVEAARLDGASEVGILLRVVLPMSRASMATVALLAFLASWDSYIWPLVAVTKEQMRTLPLGLSLFFGEYGSEYNQALAAAVVIMLPMLIVFILLQRYFVEGMTRSGLK